MQLKHIDLTTMKKNINADWKKWIAENISKGADQNLIFNILIENGFLYDDLKKELGFEPVLKEEMSEEWQSWIAYNLNDGCDRNEIFKILLIYGFSYDSIKEYMNFIPDMPLDQLPKPRLEIFDEVSNIESLEEISPLESDSPNANLRRLNSNDLEIFQVENFLSDAECRDLIHLIKDNLRPSELSSYSQDTSFRTSQTCDLGLLNNNLVRIIDERICRFTGIHESCGESIQGQYYTVGQEFKPHTDYFESHEMRDACFNQRSYTFMVYLNYVTKGGSTSFPAAGKKFLPKPGLAVIWNSLNRKGLINPKSIHSSEPVHQGYKAVITKWFRQSRLQRLT